MHDSLSQRLTEQFYNWEIRGRGWEYFDYPVDLEPPFIPFFGHYIDDPFIDDGKRQSLLELLKSVLIDPLFSLENDELISKEKESVLPYKYENVEPLFILSINLVRGHKFKPALFEQFLIMISSTNHPVSFEILGNSKSIKFQITCRESDCFIIHSHLNAFFPEFSIQIISNAQDEIIIAHKSAAIIDFGLKEEFMRPGTMTFSQELDPYISLIGILDKLGENQSASIQILFKGLVNPWSQSIIRSVMDHSGGPFFEDAPEMAKLAKDKVSALLFSVSIKVICQSDNEIECLSIVNVLSQTISKITDSGFNSLIPLTGKTYEFETYLQDIYNRESHRLGMILNSKELLNLIHFPSDSVNSKKLYQDSRKTKKAPEIALGHRFILGDNFHHGKLEIVTESTLQRLKHTHIIGATGTGKSTLLLNMILQDCENNEGLAVLDPHGDLIEAIMGRMPTNRIKDCIVIDPADSEYPIGLNILYAHSEIEKDILSSDLIALFRRLSTSWGDQMNSVFANAILAFLESNTGGTLIDLRKFLIEKNFRESFLKTVQDPSVIYYWTKEYPLLKSGSISPILTRLDTFLRPKIIRNMVAQKKCVDFEQIMDSQKILLVKLPQGLIGAENSYLLGTLIVSKIQQTALARQAKGIENRSDFFLYIDEFQNFITPSLSSILSGARKYHLGLILAHQDIQQIQKTDPEITNSVISNCGTRICFRIGDFDAKKLEDGFSNFDAKDLQNLSTGQAIARIEKPEFDFSMEINPTFIQNVEYSEIVKRSIIQYSRENYGIHKEEIEKLIEDTFQINQDTKQIPSPILIGEDIKSTNADLEKPPRSPEKSEIIDVLPKNDDLKKEKSQHRYLQTLIKKMAESRGYRASIEHPTDDSMGRVDISLAKNNIKIACEISVTSDKEWELHNVIKCLKSGYDQVFVCSLDLKHLNQIKSHLADSLQTEFKEKVFTFLPDELFLYFDQELAKESNKEVRVKGYRVKVEYNAIANHSARHKKEEILKVMTDSLKRKEKN